MVKTYKAHTNCIVMLTNINHDLCIIDGGADSHESGKTWLPLTPRSGPNVRFANATRLDEESAKKFGLPTVEGIVKVTKEDGKPLILRAKHLIYNATSPHTLMSSYQMR